MRNGLAWYRQDSVKGIGFFLTIALILFALLTVLVWVSAQRELEWQIFVRANDCVLQAASQSYTIPTTQVLIGKDGYPTTIQGAAVIPGAETWLCNNGVSYTRTK